MFKPILVAVLCGAALVAPAQLVAAPRDAAQAFTWKTVPWGGGGYIPAFLYHPKSPKILYARTDVGGLYRYDYTAQKWIPLLDDLSRSDADLMGVLAMAIDPNDPQKLYAACGLYISQWARKGAILRSNDQGRTWQKFDLSIGVGGNADGRGTGERLVVDPANGKVIYYGSNRDGLWKSSDGGANFARIAAPVSSISLLFYDPRGHVLYLGGVDGQGQLFASKDDGKTFSPVPSTPDMIPQRIAQGPDGTLFVTYARGDKEGDVNPAGATIGGLWRRDLAGNWLEITPEKPANGAKFGYSGVDVGPDGTLAVTTLDRWWPGGEIYLSRDSGKTWTGLHQQAKWSEGDYSWTRDWHGNGWFGGWMSDVKINPFNKNELIYQDQGAWVITNLGDAGSGKALNVVFPDDELEESAPLEIAVPPQGAKLLLGMGDNAGGAYFDLMLPPDEGLFRPARGNVPGIDYAGSKPLYVVRTSDSAKHKGFVSNDGGMSWAELPNSIFEMPDYPKAGWVDPGRIAVSAGATSLVWAAGTGAPYYSKDGGKSWTKSRGIPDLKDRNFRPVADKRFDGVFYIFDPTGSILASADGGANFTPIVPGFPEVASWQRAKLEVVPTIPRDLWLAAPNGLFHSPDSKHAAKQIDHVDAAWAVSFGAPRVPGGYPTVYVAGKINGVSGLWMSEDEGRSWTEITNDGRRMDLVNIVAGDMKTFGVVFVNAPHGGIMVSSAAEAVK
ncbi:sialidase family protein [Sphingomonas asaccharolytica]|uniref:sialidase family protein n=1 Tax=Sphingomonas asaccharolytica TaxID=40681 RepID=UPI001470D978|nr:sialidase family protein [Sphingomonas asaccharolytica]